MHKCIMGYHDKTTNSLFVFKAVDTFDILLRKNV